MLFRADFPAKTLVPREKALDCPAPDQDCGANLRASLAKYDLHFASSKTAQGCAVAASCQCWETFPAWGIMRDGAYLALATSAPRTPEIGYGSLLPTLLERDHQRGISRTQSGLPGWWETLGVGRSPSSRHPAFWEWLMGWPIAWGGLAPLEMAKFRQWLGLRGEFSPKDCDVDTFLTAGDFLDLVGADLPRVRLLREPPDREPALGDITVWTSFAPFPQGCDAQLFEGDDGCWYARVSRDVFEFLKEVL